jgi:hypothetical protein
LEFAGCVCEAGAEGQDGEEEVELHCCLDVGLA